jgi:glycosyltransferase involved in cell wall biosynthesis
MEPSGEKNRSAVRVLACCGGMVIVHGLERMTFEVLRVLRERGGEVHCIVNNWENYRIVPLAQQIGASWSTGYYSYRLDRHTSNPVRLAAMAANILRTSGGLIRDVWRFRPTHVFIPDFLAVFHYGPALIVLRALGIQITMRLGNPPEIGRFYRRLWRWVVNPLITRFICNSQFTQRELLGHGVPARKISYIYNTVPSRTDSSHVKEPDRGKVIYVGQIIPSKGVDLLLDAIGILAERGLDVRLDVVGQMDGWAPAAYTGHREALSERAERPDLRGRVRFLGRQEDVPRLLAEAAVHCCPSRPEQREAFGVVNIEAKKAGIPSVVTSIGALPELITHLVDGWICAEVSAESLAEGIEYFLADANRREEAGRRAQSSLQRFSREQFAEQWWNVFAPAAAARSEEDLPMSGVSRGVQT